MQLSFAVTGPLVIDEFVLVIYLDFVASSQQVYKTSDVQQPPWVFECRALPTNRHEFIVWLRETRHIVKNTYRNDYTRH